MSRPLSSKTNLHHILYEIIHLKSIFSLFKTFFFSTSTLKMKTLLYRKNQLVPSDTAIKRFYCNSLHVRSFVYHKSRRNDRRKGVICTYTYYRNDPRFLKIRNVDDNVDPVAQVLVDDNITLDHVQRLLIQRIDYILYNIGIHGNRTRRIFFLIIHIWRYTNILCIIKYGKYNYFPV